MDAEQPLKELMNPDNLFSAVDALKAAVGPGASGNSDTMSEQSVSSGEVVVDTLLVPADGVEVLDPTDPAYTGHYIDKTGFTFGSIVAQLAGVLNGVFQWGANTSGQLVAGAGAVRLDQYGEKITGLGVLFEFSQSNAYGYQFGAFEILPDAAVAFISFGNATQKAITDYNFNSGALGSGWSASVGTPTFSTTNAISGSSYSLLLNANSEAVVSDYITGLGSGYQSLLDFWVLDTAAQGLNVTIEYFNSSSVSLGTKSIALNLTGDGTSKRIVYLFNSIAPINTTKAKLTLANGLTGGSAPIYLQSVALYQGSGIMILNGLIIGTASFLDNVSVSGLIAAVGNVTGANLSGSNTGDVTLTGTGSYLTLAGQVLTKAPIPTSLGGYGNLLTLGAGVTQYMGPFQSQGPSATENDVRWPGLYDGQISELRVSTRTAQPATGTLVFTFRVAGADTSVVVTIAAGAAAGIYSDAAHTATVAAANVLVVKIINNALLPSAMIGAWSAQLDVT